ncbi:MAG TPA: DUF2934 domain-containing protein [Polyangia bacterium]|jgi:hypothetical protein|nr:DUF2934 domain-containing protein [Polyangia bacterium]
MRKADQDAFSSAGPAHQADPEAIARRAYELFQQRGSEPGHEIEDWLQAEAELTARAEGANTGDLGDGLDGAARLSGAAPSAGTSSTSTSAPPARKGNAGRRAQRQPNGH